jgi:hypothetical protein
MQTSIKREISAQMRGNMSLVADGGFLTRAFKSHIIALNGNHLASCKTQKYTASGM